MLMELFVQQSVDHVHNEKRTYGAVATIKVFPLHHSLKKIIVKR